MVLENLVASFNTCILEKDKYSDIMRRTQPMFKNILSSQADHE